MTLVRWQPTWHRGPFAGINTLQHQMNRLFEDVFQNDAEDRAVIWSPRVDLTEFDDHYEVTAELPGMTHEEVKLELENNLLTISGEKHTESERKDRNLYVCERNFGSFRRSFQFPSQIEPSKIDAGFKDGILTVSLPKIEEAKPKQIEIKVH
jgi:HSP20 family protein